MEKTCITVHVEHFGHIFLTSRSPSNRK